MDGDGDGDGDSVVGEENILFVHPHQDYRHDFRYHRLIVSSFCAPLLSSPAEKESDGEG